MKHWQETRQVVERLSALRSRGARAALATVVRVRGSAYRRPGAKLLVDEEGAILGNVSGGCLEQDVREVALRVIESGCAELRAYCSGTDPIDAWDLGIGCEGEVEVYVRPAGADMALLRERLEGEDPFACCYILHEGAGAPASMLLVGAGDVVGTVGDAALDTLLVERVRPGAEEGESGLMEISGSSVFVERFHPPPHLLVCGAGEDARPLVRLALEAGFRVTVADRRSALLAPGRFPADARLVHAPSERIADVLPAGGELYALLMTHSFADDGDYAAALATVPLRYLGILGPRARTERLLSSAGLTGLLDDPHVYGPVGLDIGTEGAEQVAISIVAELLAARSGRSGTPLRERCMPIHALGA